MRMRPVKRSPEGRYSRDRVRTLLDAVHILEQPPEAWEVRTLGEKGASKRFKTKEQAVEYARELKPGSKIVVHHREPKKVTFARLADTGGGRIQEQLIR